MPPTRKLWYGSVTPYIKDAIYIIGIGVATYGWISSKAENKAIMETTIKYNTEEIKKMNNFVEKQVDLNQKEAEVLGILMEFKNSHQR